MSNLRRVVHGRLHPKDYRLLQQEAAARGISLSACMADCLREYFAVRVDMASAIAAPGKPGDPHTGLIHSLLGRTEERLAATFETQTTELIDQLQVLESVVDQFVQLYLLHTPEVANELRAAVVTSANRRYANFRQAVSEQVAAGGLNGTGGAQRLRAGDSG